jgi:putative sigma-54 modulation protein
MKIQIRHHDSLVTDKLRTHVLRRLGFALGRYGENIGNVIVRFSHTDGSPGALDKRCQIEVGLARGVEVEEVDADLFVAVNRAADRASRAVARALAREREGIQGPPRPPGGGRPKP